MSTLPELVILGGPLADRRYAVAVTGLRLGRSSSCEISVPDPALSRSHCLFELRAGEVWVTDLASANGTLVNGTALGAESCRLRVGDRVLVGETELAVVEPGAPMPAASAAPATVDLGLGTENTPEAEGGGRSSARRLALWICAVLAVAGAAVVILSGGEAEKADTPVERPAPAERPELRSIVFEKVEADADGIYRSALRFEASSGRMAVEIDDVPKENRHVRKAAQLSAAAREKLAAIFSAEDLYRLDAEYTGVPLKSGTLKSFSLRVVRGARVTSISVENTQEPEIFKTVREQLETFSKNELGIWAIQYSAEKLVEMSQESRRAGDAKWKEADVQYGNLAAALAAYREAVFYLDTVNPKPADYGALVNQMKKAERALEKRYRDQRFLADRAINLGDWETARRELRVLCELVPDVGDARHAEAEAKLLDVEARMKKGGRR